MDTYFFDNPPKAIMKGGFLFVTYVGSILFKQFSIEVVLPTVLIYMLSNLPDYFELAFLKEDKVKKIRYWSLGIFLAMLFITVITFCVFTTDNQIILKKVESCYGIFYILCLFVWAIPMFDGVRGQCDKIRASSVIIERQMRSDRPYQVMINGTLQIECDETEKKTYSDNETNPPSG